jgi:hypothetical protein
MGHLLLNTAFLLTYMAGADPRLVLGLWGLYLLAMLIKGVRHFLGRRVRR